MPKLGYNVEGNDLGSQKSQIVSELTSYRANWHLCLGDEALAVKLTLYVTKGVIYRVFDPFNEHSSDKTFDNSFWQRHTPEAIIQYVRNTHSHLLQYDNLVFLSIPKFGYEQLSTLQNIINRFLYI